MYRASAPTSPATRTYRRILLAGRIWSRTSICALGIEIELTSESCDLYVWRTEWKCRWRGVRGVLCHGTCTVLLGAVVAGLSHWKDFIGRKRNPFSVLRYDISEIVKGFRCSWRTPKLTERLPEVLLPIPFRVGSEGRSMVQD